jgi:uncharacterized RDD family membrane protein YckC
MGPPKRSPCLALQEGKVMRSSAGIPKTSQRFFARLTDQVIKFFLEFPFWVQIFRAVFLDEGAVRIHLIWVAYFVFIRLCYDGLGCFFFGATLGKYLFNLRVVNRDHSDHRLGLAQSFFRAIASELSFFLSWALYATLFFRYDRSHWIDLWARTRVISMQGESDFQRHRPKIRWMIGSLMALFFLISGLERAGTIISGLSLSDNYLEIEIMSPDSELL